MTKQQKKQKIKELLARVSAIQSPKRDEALSFALMRLGTGLTNLPDREKDIKPLATSVTSIKKDFATKQAKMTGSMEKGFFSLEELINKTGEGVTDYTKKNVDVLVQEIKALKKEVRATITDLQTTKDVADIEKSGFRKKLTSVDTELGTILTTLKEEISSRSKSEETITTSLSSLRSNLKKIEESTDNKLSGAHKEFMERFSSIESKLGGGSMNRQIKVGGTDVLTRYTDINLVAGSGVTIATANDNTDKNVDITISSSVTSAGYQVPTGTVNGSNQVFVFAVAPNVISVDGLLMRAIAADSTVNWTGTTTITLTVAPNFEIFGVA